MVPVYLIEYSNLPDSWVFWNMQGNIYFSSDLVNPLKFMVEFETHRCILENNYV